MEGAELVGQPLARIPLETSSNRRDQRAGQPSTSSARDLAFRRYNNMLRLIDFHAVRRKSTPPENGLPLQARKPSFFQILWADFLLSPVLLSASLFIILVVPEKLVKKVTAPFSGVNFWTNFGKRAFDFVVAVMAFILASILFLIVPIFIKTDSPGPVYYGQQRAGLNHRRRERRQVSIAVAHDRRRVERRKMDLFGRPFIVYKFRTMRQDAEKLSGAVWAQKNDPRITRVGKVLRFTHIDEIPQFLNVLFGEMSMVGPRPERPQIIPSLVKEVPDYERRLEVKPGMTGIAQIYCGYDATIDDVRQKVRYDLTYVENNTLKADMIILVKTLWMIIRGRETADT